MGFNGCYSYAKPNRNSKPKRPRLDLGYGLYERGPAPVHTAHMRLLIAFIKHGNIKLEHATWCMNAYYNPKPTDPKRPRKTCQYFWYEETMKRWEYIQDTYGSLIKDVEKDKESAWFKEAMTFAEEFRNSLRRG